MELAGTFEGQHVRKAAGLEYIANGRILVTQELGRRLRLDRGSRPDREDLAGQPVQWPK